MASTLCPFGRFHKEKVISCRRVEILLVPERGVGQRPGAE